MADRVSTGAEIIYGTGFTSHGGPGQQGVKINVDNNVIDLYQRLAGNITLAGNFNFRKEVCVTAARLLLPLPNWLLATRSNYLHSKHALLFARDLGLIAMGKSPDMSVMTRMRLFSPSSVKSNPGELNASNYDALSLIPNKFIDELRTYSNGTQLANLTRDAQHVKDLVTSLYVMFGSVE
ncbi:hypothetical protein FDH97_gp300 [Erwinia phage vB_EamM_Deimos-Minion]|uniref:Uncharacterized protein n=1 Tax=Erwinia phage vB_EamM_Deimos-Minion TaxID=1815986 RepID=A0A173GG05_9CAUD|nr:hypothetical protein FDH97_gp300 [Erwinia phage vB_EamM_Deimos-Minion]ANH52399.2 hypothetical protein DM_300 [Erwinia phage vB_EamM_Deimos-Minion]